MRLVITTYGKKATVAFLLDPTIVDIPGKSYLLEWGRPKANKNLEQYMSATKAADSTFHTFFYPLTKVSCAITEVVFAVSYQFTKNNWYYIGAMEWTPISPPVADIWATLNDAVGFFDWNTRGNTDTE